MRRKSNKNHTWTEEERVEVRRDYRGTTASAGVIAAHLGVTLYAVKGQVQTMGLGQRERRSWSPKEDAQLEKLMAQHCPRRVAKLMHRSINSVVIRSKRLSISRTTRDGWFTKAEVCGILGVDHKWVQKRIDLGALKARYHDEESPPGKNGGSCWHIEEKDLREYIRRYPQDLTARNVDLIMIVDILAGINNNHQRKEVSFD